jgi:hypothetical protein
MADELDGLNDTERLALKATIQGIAANTPMTEVAAVGFLQVSLSKVPRPLHRAASPASRAEALPMNASDYPGVIDWTKLPMRPR